MEICGDLQLNGETTSPEKFKSQLDQLADGYVDQTKKTKCTLFMLSYFARRVSCTHTWQNRTGSCKCQRSVPSQIIMSSWIPPSPFPLFSHTHTTEDVHLHLPSLPCRSVDLPVTSASRAPWCIWRWHATRCRFPLPSARTHTASSCLHTRDHRWTHTSNLPKWTHPNFLNTRPSVSKSGFLLSLLFRNKDGASQG